MRTLFCKVCKQQIGVVDDLHPEPSTDEGKAHDPANEDDAYCSVHHPNPDHQVVDKPTVRMTVNINKEV